MREMKRVNRAEKAGIDLANSIAEIANLMYQNNTRSNFYNGLIKTLEDEQAK